MNTRPSATNDLLETWALLANGLHTDPLLCLASAVVWLDPLWQEGGDHWDSIVQDEEDALAVALRVIRTAFPDIYVQAVEHLREGASYHDVDRLICNAISDLGIPLDDLQWIGAGIPLPAYGVLLDDTDFYMTFPDTIPVLTHFGISYEPDASHVTVPDNIHTAGQLIAESLEDHDDDRCKQIAWLLRWLFSCSGNSSVDWDYETMAEVVPLSWDGGDLAFALEIIEEAEAIMADAMAGLDFLNSHPKMLRALERNVQRAYKMIQKQKGKPDASGLRLVWPHIANGAE